MITGIKTWATLRKKGQAGKATDDLETSVGERFALSAAPARKVEETSRLPASRGPRGPQRASWKPLSLASLASRAARGLPQALPPASRVFTAGPSDAAPPSQLESTFYWSKAGIL